jgi:hypothetical protein
MLIDTLKKIGIHVGVILIMSLGLFLSSSFISILKWDFLKVCSAMLLGAYTLKPLADWVCKKVL